MRKVLCPRCGNETIFSSENPSRPFCSERCRLIDLGQWASESYRIEVQDASSSEELIDAMAETLEDSEHQDQVQKNSRRNSEDLS